MDRTPPPNPSRSEWVIDRRPPVRLAVLIGVAVVAIGIGMHTGRSDGDARKAPVTTPASASTTLPPPTAVPTTTVGTCVSDQFAIVDLDTCVKRPAA